MHIAIVNHYASPPGAKGGPTRHLGLSRGLHARGHDVTIHASAYDHYSRAPHRDLNGLQHLVEEADGVRYVWWSTPAYASTLGRIRNMSTFAWRLRRTAESVTVPRPDVVLGSSPHLLAAEAARRYAQRLRVPFVFEVRDLWPQSLIDLGELRDGHPAIRALKALERSLYRSAAEVVLIPGLARPYVIANGGSAERITVIPNGVDLEPAAAPPPPAPTSSHLFTLVYAGTLGHANGLDTVVRAGRILEDQGHADIRIRLVGPGPERQDLERLRDALGASLVTLEDPVPAAAVPGLLAGADACLLVLRDSPVFRWGISPTKLFEYFAAARPVITSVAVPDDPVVRAGAGVAAKPGDPVDLARSIVDLARMTPASRRAMGLAGHATLASHSFAALSAQMESVLERASARDAGDRAGWSA